MLSATENRKKKFKLANIIKQIYWQVTALFIRTVAHISTILLDLLSSWCPLDIGGKLANAIPSLASACDNTQLRNETISHDSFYH